MNHEQKYFFLIKFEKFSFGVNFHLDVSESCMIVFVVIVFLRI